MSQRFTDKIHSSPLPPSFQWETPEKLVYWCVLGYILPKKMEICKAYLKNKETFSVHSLCVKVPDFSKTLRAIDVTLLHIIL